MAKLELQKGAPITDWVKCYFPGYKKRAINVVTGEIRQVHPPTGGWDSGSKDYAEIVKLSGGREPAPQAMLFGDTRSQMVDINDDQCMVVTGTFCGKPATLQLYCTEKFLRQITG